jgi:hypothetical protein
MPSRRMRSHKGRMLFQVVSLGLPRSRVPGDDMIEAAVFQVLSFAIVQGQGWCIRRPISSEPLTSDKRPNGFLFQLADLINPPHITAVDYRAPAQFTGPGRTARRTTGPLKPGLDTLLIYRSLFLSSVDAELVDGTQ